MKLIEMTCPHCGAVLKLDPTRKKAFCEYCGCALLLDDEVQHEVRHIQYDNAEEAGYKFEKGRQRARAEAMRRSPSPAPQDPYLYQRPRKKRRHTLLWILGWIFVFPLPLTILLVRKKDMNPVVKYVIIAAAWIFYLTIGFAGNANAAGLEMAEQVAMLTGVPIL